MKPRATILAATVLFSALALPLFAETYTNPVWSRNWPDPTVWRGTDGFFYSLATPGTRRSKLIRSRDLVKWEQTEISPFTPETWETLYRHGQKLWAPDAIKILNRYLLYITVYNSDRDSSIAVLKSDTPTGPYAFHSFITRSKETGIKDTIDPEVVIDPLDRRVWLFFGSIGRIHRVQLSVDGLSLAPNAKYVPVAGLDVSQNPNRSNVFEGCYLYRRGGYWYLFASGGNFGNHTYRIVVGRSKSLTGTFTDKSGKPMTEGFATTVLSSSDAAPFYGPGHNGEIFSDKLGRTFMLYHCHAKSAPPQLRFLMLQEIKWDSNGWPYFQDGQPAASAEKGRF